MESSCRTDCESGTEQSQVNIEIIPSQFINLEPAAFLDAATKGLGRAIIAVRDGFPGQYDELIVESCLHDPQWSRYYEAIRFPYQMRLVELAGIEDRVLSELLSGVKTCTHTGDIEWIFAMLAGFVRRGDQAAFEILKERAFAGNDWAEISLAHAGDESLEWLIENVLPRRFEDGDGLLSWYREDETPEPSLVQLKLKAILDRYWQDEENKRVEEAPPYEKLSPRQFLDRLINSGETTGATADFREEATDEECQELVDLWPNGGAADHLNLVTSVLARRSVSFDFQRLFQMAEASPREYYTVTRFVLNRIDHPAIREYCLRKLSESPIPNQTLIAFKASFEYGDEAILTAALPHIEAQGIYVRFGLTTGLLDLMDWYEDANWQTCAEWIYEKADDSTDRLKAVQWMAEFGEIPAYIREEAPFDAEPVIRKFVSK